VSSLADIDRLLASDRSAEALALIEGEWQPDTLTAARHHALASRGMVASYTVADYPAALLWLERTRKHAGSEAQPYLGLLAATFRRLSAVAETRRPA
jgi:hypothetical protein